MRLSRAERQKLQEAVLGLRLLPRDFARVRAGENLSHLERLASMGKNVARTTKRDIRGIHRLQKMRSDKDPRVRGAKILDRSGLYHYASADKQKKAQYFLDRAERAKSLQRRYATDLSYKIGAGALAAAAAGKGIRAFKRWQQKSRSPVYHRQYDVYPEHGYAAVGIQPYNQPYYDAPPLRSGAPRYAEARVGSIYNEDVREKLIEHITRTVFE